MAKRSIADIEKIWSNVEGVKKLSDRVVGIGPFGVGLDGLLAFVPGVGALYTVGAAGWLLNQAVKAKATPATLAQMGAWLGVDTLTTLTGEPVMSFRLSQRSLDRLAGVHPALVGVVKAAILRTPVDFMVTEGLRTPERQAALVKAGASRTLKSRHLTGHAVDVAAMVDGQVRWDWPLYPRIAAAFKAVARERGVALIWGGDWKTLRDGPHFELDRAVWP